MVEAEGAAGDVVVEAVEVETRQPTQGESPESGQLTIMDERSQANYDRAAIEQTVNQIRGLMANAKVNMRLAQEGLLDKDHDLHPVKFKEAIAQHRKALTLLKVAWDEVGELGLPEPSSLEIV